MSSSDSMPQDQDSIVDTNQERNVIDQEILTLYEEIRRLRSKRNTLASISRLSPDVLRIIFIYSRFTDTAKTALILSWVSRDWRDLAISIHRLWATISFTHPDWINASISRAGSLDLEIRVDKADLPRPFPQILIDNLPRSREVAIYAEELVTIDTSIVISSPPPSLSRLEKLSLREIKFVGGFFTTALPVLTRLSLVQCQLDWNHLPPMPKLTSLIIDLPHDQINVEKLLKILTTTPDLEFLHLAKAFPEPEGAIPASKSRIQLPKLQTIWFHKVWLDAARPFLDSIQIPHTANGRLDLYGNESTNSLSIMDSFVSSRTALIVAPHVTVQTNIRLHRLSFDATDFSFRMSYPGLVPITDAIGRSVSLADLQAITLLGYNHNIDPAHFCQVFRLFTSIRSLTLGGSYVYFFLSSIGLQNQIFSQSSSAGDIHQGTRTRSSEEVLIFLGLKELTIGAGYFPVGQDTDISDLPKWLRYQKARGADLEFLVVKMIKVPDELKAELEGLVEEAVWGK